MRILRVALLTFATALWSWPSQSQTGSSQAERINAMRQGGYVIVLRHGATLRKIAATVPPAGSNVIVVTHRPNILDAFGKDWFDMREGEASIFAPDGTGGYKLIARVQADEWNKLAQAGAN